MNQKTQGFIFLCATVCSSIYKALFQKNQFVKWLSGSVIDQPWAHVPAHEQPVDS